MGRYGADWSRGEAMPSNARTGTRPPWPERTWLKLAGLGVRGFFGAKRLAYRARPGPKLRHIDHITIPCGDLRVAEDFYVGVLGAKVMMRIDAKMLERMGWSREQIEVARAVHLSLTLQAGPRIDLFQYPEGEPRACADMHPHIALTAAPQDYLGWKRRLEAQGVVTSEIMRPGPPGQASFYFNDPFGNHLEIITLGFVERTLAPGVPDRSRLNYRWRSSERPSEPSA
jgi:catechol 2,3-dioxygenase-like lactoylglutathione lyase family enzyme